VCGDPGASETDEHIVRKGGEDGEAYVFCHCTCSGVSRGRDSDW